MATTKKSLHQYHFDEGYYNYFNSELTGTDRILQYFIGSDNKNVKGLILALKILVNVPG